MRNFKELKIWQQGFEIAVESYKLTSSFPSSEKLSLSSQITRADVSIPSNIAEGSSRSSEKDYGRFIEISLGSSFELETQLLIAKAVGFAADNKADTLLHNGEEEQKMFSAFFKNTKITSD